MLDEIHLLRNQISSFQQVFYYMTIKIENVGLFMTAKRCSY
jgi:hypothetical protein